MAEPAKEKTPIKPAEESRKKDVVQRAEAAPARAPSPPASISPLGGSPLPKPVRSFMEPRFGASFGNVRIHTGEAAAQQSAALSAHAFTVGEHVFFGRNQFQPETASGRELIAHELTHTIQQGAAIQRSVDPVVAQRTGVEVHRSSLGQPFDTFADWANAIPGFRLLTVVLGINPINMAPVERSAINVLRGLLELIPVTGPLIVQALEHYGIMQKAAAWIEVQVRALGLAGGALIAALKEFVSSLGLLDIARPGNVWERAKRIFTEPIARLIAVGKAAVVELLKIVREAVLLPLAKLAEGTRGYDLLKAVLGEDPVTGQPVPRSPENLIGGFLKLIGQEDIWQNMQKANAIPRAWAWFQQALAGLMGFVRQIPGLFKTALSSLEIMDLFPPIKAFVKVAGVFGSFVGEFISWGLNAAWKLLEIIFEVVSPNALKYIKRTGAALKSILKNPLPFVGNLVKAAKLGFQNFAGNFLTHLKAGLIGWLTGSLPGIYIPKSFSLVEIVKFVFSVLGLSWANIRAKLVKVVGEPAVKAMEIGFDIVVTLVRDGPAAAWDKIKEQLANLKEMAIGAITDFVVDLVVKKAVPKLISMFIPGAGFISAILSIYDTIKTFIEKLSQIAQVVMAFIDSIVAIAAGQIGAAAARVEKILAGLLSLTISFVASFLGLGKVADKIMAIIAKIRAPIDKAIDWLINWIVTMAKKLFAKVFGKEKKTETDDPKKSAQIQLGLAQLDALAAPLVKDGKFDQAAATNIAATVKKAHPVFKTLVPVEGKDSWDFDYEASPKTRHPGGSKGGKPKITITRSTFTVDTKWNLFAEDPESHKKMTKDSGPRLKKQLHRRHVISSKCMADHYETVLNACATVAAAKAILEKRGEANVGATNAAVQAAAQARHHRFFNDTKNLFIGDASENVSIGAVTDIPEDWTKREWNKHLKYVKDTYALDSTFTPY